jgi:hypothetical protein
VVLPKGFVAIGGKPCSVDPPAWCGVVRTL